MQQPERVIISGGGTGGHIFPAIAIANALKAEVPGIEILFVGAKGRMEMEKVPEAGYKIEGLWISGLQRSLKLSNLAFPVKVLSSLYRARVIINKFKPQAAVGVGGYASGPLLYAAASKKIPCLIQEQNSYPGITNKLLANKVQKICVAYDRMDRFFPASKIVKTGNPVREQMISIAGKAEQAAEHFKLRASMPTLLIVGGSQGARSINKSILAGLEQIHQSGIQVVWQCGKSFYEEAVNAVEKLNTDKIKVFDFIKRMDFAYALASALISRAGASTVSELCIVAKPAILVPLPTAAEDHQTHNCLALTEKNAVILVKDADAMSTLVNTALDLIKDEKKKSELSENIAKEALRDAAGVIAREVLKLIRN